MRVHRDHKTAESKLVMPRNIHEVSRISVKMVGLGLQWVGSLIMYFMLQQPCLL